MIPEQCCLWRWIVWAVYWLVYLLQPVRSIYPDVDLAWMLQFLFVPALSLACTSASSCFRRVQGRCPPRAWIQPGRGERGHTLGAVDFASRVCLPRLRQGVRAGDRLLPGLAAAREQWRLLGEERHGEVSSPFSALGSTFSAVRSSFRWG